MWAAHRPERERQMMPQREKAREKKHLKQQALKNMKRSDRGTWSERQLVRTLLKAGIPNQVIFHDLYLRKPNGGCAQIDVVVPTSAGIIVFEVKDYSGWLFGKGDQEQWTQVLAYGKEKYRFYNPIRQNKRHVEELKKQLRPFGEIPFYSVVVFYGDCELRDIRFVPDGTFVVKSERVLECVATIRKTGSAQYTDTMGMVEILRQAVRNGEDERIRAQHVEDIKEMLGTERVFG